MEKPVTELSGVGDKVASKLKRLKIESIGDLLQHYPRKYDDYSKITPISDIKPGPVTIGGKFEKVNSRYVRRGLHITEAFLSDGDAEVKIVWFNQPYRAKAIKDNKKYFVSGSLEFNKSSYTIMNPSAELADSKRISTGSIVAIYPETKGLKSHQIRKLIESALNQVKDIPSDIPDYLEKEYKLESLDRATRDIHRPKNIADIDSARRRLAFSEIFSLILGSTLLKLEIEELKAPVIEYKNDETKKFVGELPYELTNAQKKVAWKILQEVEDDTPTNRLIEGDVGSGKTIVAAMVMLNAARNNLQSAVLAPTEVLARQHYKNLSELFKEYGINVILLISALNSKDKKQALEEAETGTGQIVVGTHALFEESVRFNNLGVAIIDEQQRFGVKQRQGMLKKSETSPHMISMSATPIPRTLALTLYGELSLSVIDEMPKGRKPIKTKIINTNKRKELYEQVSKKIDKGEQVFVVCPLIDKSDVLPARSATDVFDYLSEKVLKKYKVELMHGRLKTDQKEKIMKNFSDGKIDVLVSTTVIEVGVDVPNANIMIIESAERFGLAQIHQLRGRVGRSSKQAYCFLVPTDSKSVPRRLSELERNVDGFKLAEIDLELRGPGAIYGTRQHGDLDLKIAKLTDLKLIANAQAAVALFIKKEEELIQYPQLAKRVDHFIKITNLN